MKHLSTMALVSVLACGVLPGAADRAETPPAEDRVFTVRPIGVVHKTEQRTRIEVQQKYQPGLLGLDGFSHVYVLWWFDRNDTPEGRSTLQVHPRGDRNHPLTGVFATRSPRRPNLIALSLCKILSVKENIVELEAFDAFDGTPVLDLKPFLPGYDSTTSARTPEWAGRR
jgi:tRNA-Thr(GGU) m(6)t(6)A37 methyltransferase TsaA